jgi:isopenicillin N synthase-like dioxygenase
LEGIDDFKKTTLEYYTAVCKLAIDVLAVLALGLDLAENYFDGFASGAVAAMRLLHCPQPADSNEKLSRGTGAHTDFGAVTLLMQEEVDGLQVWDNGTKTWLDVSEAPKRRIFIDIRRLSLQKAHTL